MKHRIRYGLLFGLTTIFGAPHILAEPPHPTPPNPAPQIAIILHDGLPHVPITIGKTDYNCKLDTERKHSVISVALYERHKIDLNLKTLDKKARRDLGLKAKDAYRFVDTMPISLIDRDVTIETVGVGEVHEHGLVCVGVAGYRVNKAGEASYGCTHGLGKSFPSKSAIDADRNSLEWCIIGRDAFYDLKANTEHTPERNG